jgi:hypothetical protein
MTCKILNHYINLRRDEITVLKDLSASYAHVLPGYNRFFSDMNHIRGDSLNLINTGDAPRKPRLKLDFRRKRKLILCKGKFSITNMFFTCEK